MKRFSWFKPAFLVAVVGLNCALSAAAQEVKREPADPSFSADAKRLVYIVGITKADEVLSSSSEIWTINMDGSEARQLTTGANDDHPRFSPDGQSIAFVRDDDIWLINADGSGLRNLTNTAESDESGAEFTNDGSGLLLLREAIEKEDDEMMADIIAKEPLAALGLGGMVQSLVLHDLNSSVERVLLGDGYDIEQIAPNPTDSNAVFMLCRPLDADGKPTDSFIYDPVIAVAKLDGAPPRTVFAPKPESKLHIHRFWVAPTRNVLEVDTPDHYANKIGQLENGEIVFLSDAPILGDMSSDGSLLAGIGLVPGANFDLVLYDFETRKVGALKDFENAISPQAKAFFEQGVQYFHDDKYVEAISEFTKAVVLHPQYAEAFYYRGWSHDFNGNPDSGLRDLGEAIRLDPQGPQGLDSYMMRARILERAERSGEAIDDYSAALRINPAYATALFERGEIYRERLETDMALADYDAAIKLDSDNLAYLMARGDLRFELGDNAGSLADYSAAIQHYPDWREAYRQRAKLYRLMGQADLAAADEKKAEALM